jgi:membrane fusion protein (multidrug efflux system)
VLQVLVADNQPVQAGDLLVEIDPGDFAVDLAHALASAAEAAGRLEQASWHLLVAEAERALAEAEVVAVQAHRRNAVAERTDAELALTMAQLKEVAAVAQVNLARAQLETAAAGGIAAAAAVEQARRRLAYTEIRAPQTGRVRVKRVEPGEYVQVGQELLALVADDLGGPATSQQ